MSNEAIKLTDGSAVHIDDVIIKAPRLHGFLAFQRLSEGGAWMQVYPMYPPGVSPPNNTPLPLFRTRDAVIAQVQDMQHITGEVKIFEVSE